MPACGTSEGPWAPSAAGGLAAVGGPLEPTASPSPELETLDVASGLVGLPVALETGGIALDFTGAASLPLVQEG